MNHIDASEQRNFDVYDERAMPKTWNEHEGWAQNCHFLFNASSNMNVDDHKVDNFLRFLLDYLLGEQLVEWICHLPSCFNIHRTLLATTTIDGQCVKYIQEFELPMGIIFQIIYKIRNWIIRLDNGII